MHGQETLQRCERDRRKENTHKVRIEKLLAHQGYELTLGSAHVNALLILELDLCDASRGGIRGLGNTGTREEGTQARETRTRDGTKQSARRKHKRDTRTHTQARAIANEVR